MAARRTRRGWETLAATYRSMALTLTPSLLPSPRSCHQQSRDRTSRIECSCIQRLRRALILGGCSGGCKLCLMRAPSHWGVLSPPSPVTPPLSCVPPHPQVGINDTVQLRLMRPLILGAAGAAGARAQLDQAAELVVAAAAAAKAAGSSSGGLMDAIPADLRATALVLAVRSGNATAYEAVMAAYLQVLGECVGKEWSVGERGGERGRDEREG